MGGYTWPLKSSFKKRSFSAIWGHTPPSSSAGFLRAADSIKRCIRVEVSKKLPTSLPPSPPPPYVMKPAALMSPRKPPVRSFLLLPILMFTSSCMPRGAEGGYQLAASPAPKKGKSVSNLSLERFSIYKSNRVILPTPSHTPPPPPPTPHTPTPTHATHVYMRKTGRLQIFLLRGETCNR